MFLGKTLNAHSSSLYTGVKIGTSELSKKTDEILGGGGGRGSDTSSHARIAG